MDGGLITAIAAAGISAGAAGVSIWQARTASAAAKAAGRQADAAEEATKAAQDQVELLRRQLDAEAAHQREARGPAFSIKYRGSSRHMPHGTVYFEFAQGSGPALQTIEVHAKGEGVHGLHDARTSGTAATPRSPQPSVEVGPISEGGKVDVHVALDPAAQGSVPVRFTLVCRSEDGADTWKREYTADAHGPGRSSFSSMTRSIG